MVSALWAMTGTYRAAAQQDPIFSQYMFTTQAINPAYAGIWEKIGFNTLVRKQWAGIQRSPFTQLFSFHMPVFNENIGIGLNIVADTYGYEERLSIFGDYAYEVLLSPTVYLRLGLKAGFMNYQNPLSRYQLFDEDFDPAFQEDIDIPFMPNFGFGTFLYSDNFYVGFSIPRLVENRFESNRNNYMTLIEVRHFYLNMGYVFPLGENLKFKPALMFRAALGAPAQIDMSANFMLYDRLWLGAMVRTGDALCFLAQWSFSNNIRLGYAMDVTFSDIYRYQNGTYEFTLSYDVDFYGRSYRSSKYF